MARLFDIIIALTTVEDCFHIGGGGWHTPLILIDRGDNVVAGSDPCIKKGQGARFIQNISKFI